MPLFYIFTFIFNFRKIVNHLTIHPWNHIQMLSSSPVRTKSRVGILCGDADVVFSWTNILWVVLCCVVCVRFSRHHNTLEWLKWKRLTSHFDANPELSLTFSTVSYSKTGHTVGVFFLFSYSHWHKNCRFALQLVWGRGAQRKKKLSFQLFSLRGWGADFLLIHHFYVIHWPEETPPLATVLWSTCFHICADVCHFFETSRKVVQCWQRYTSWLKNVSFIPYMNLQSNLGKIWTWASVSHESQTGS